MCALAGYRFCHRFCLFRVRQMLIWHFSMPAPHIIVGLGEILWDLLPEGKKLGGAPSNFAYISTLLGDHGIVASRVGKDPLGQEVIRKLHSLNLDGSYLQIDEAHATGTVSVELDAQKQPHFNIHEHVAWDFLEYSEAWQNLAAAADAICFGSLAQRSPSSRATIRRFLRDTRAETIRIFDVNLRQFFYSAEILRDSLQLATIVKMNHDELPVLSRLLNLTHPAKIMTLGPKLVCVTRGAHGSLLMTEKEVVEHNGFHVQVVDTIGSGDAFTAALVHYYLRGASLVEMSDAANRMGSWLATQAGGTPIIHAADLQRCLASLAPRKSP
jgi:fructokinase